MAVEFNEFQGELAVNENERFAVVVSRYNSNVTDNLLDGAVSTLKKHGAQKEQIDVYRVPGAWELSAAAWKLVESGRYVGLICLGAVVKGETTHDQYINQHVSQSLGTLSQDYGVPVAFGLLTCNTMDQAIQRAGGDYGNKGIECAEAALEMVHLFKQIDGI